MLEKLKQRIEWIDDEKMFAPQDVVSMGVVVNTKLVPSVFTFYRLIKRGHLKAINLGGGGAPRYFVKGKDLKDFLLARYQIEIITLKPKPKAKEKVRAKKKVKK